MEKAANEKERDKKVYFCRRIPLSRGSFEGRNCNRTYRFDQTDLPKDWTVNDVEMYIVPEAIVKILRETETTQGVFAVCEKHERSSSY